MFIDAFIPLALIIIVIAVVLLVVTRRKRNALGLPVGALIYEDSPEQPGHVLVSHTLKLAGKPDALIQHGSAIIPVEVKTGRTPDTPFPGHIMQLAAYCHLVEQEYHVRPTYGIIRYEAKEFTIPYTPELEQQLAAVLADMHANRLALEVHRSHIQRARCAACGYRTVCTERLDREFQPRLL